MSLPAQKLSFGERVTWTVAGVIYHGIVTHALARIVEVTDEGAGRRWLLPATCIHPAPVEIPIGALQRADRAQRSTRTPPCQET